LGKKIKIVEYDIKFLTTPKGILKNIVLTLYTQDGRKMNMYNIPLEIALELEKYASNHEMDPNDLEYEFRYSIFDVMMELPTLEEIIKESVSEIYINNFDPEMNIYSAEVVVKMNYTGAEKKIHMIPSHAILLSILGNIPVYVDSDLLEEEPEYDDEIDLEDLEDLDDLFDEDDDSYM